MEDDGKLAGNSDDALLFEPNGRPMSRTRGQKGSKVYRYYVTRFANGKKREDAWRVPAGGLDQMVIDNAIKRMRRKDGSDNRCREKWMSDRAKIRSYLQDLESGSIAQKREALLDPNCSVQLNKNNVQITLDPDSADQPIHIEQHAELVRGATMVSGTISNTTIRLTLGNHQT